MKKTKCFVFGGGGHARVVIGLLQSDFSDEYEVICAVDAAPPHGEEILGVRLKAFKDEAKNLHEAGVKAAFIAIGDIKRREMVYGSLKLEGFQLPNLIAKSAIVHRSATMGEANVICPFVHIGPLVRMGSNNLVNTQANIEHECEVGSHVHLAPNSVCCGRVKIGDGVMLGTSAAVIPGKMIANGVTVGAGASVVADLTESGKTYVGVPAKIVR